MASTNMASTTELRSCPGCCIPQPVDQFQDLANFQFPGENGMKTSSRCISCQSSELEMTADARKRTRTIANLAPTADPDTQVCTKCNHSKSLVHFASYRDQGVSTLQCSECRDTSLKAKGRDPPEHLFPTGQDELVWVVVGPPPSQ